MGLRLGINLQLHVSNIYSTRFLLSFQNQEIMVAFRSTVNMGYGISLEVVLVAQWGFYGFVSNLLSIIQYGLLT